MYPRVTWGREEASDCGEGPAPPHDLLRAARGPKGSREARRLRVTGDPASEESASHEGKADMDARRVPAPYLSPEDTHGASVH